jgi:hypothetical protein
MFNFQPFNSNQPGATRAHLLDEDGRPSAFVAFTLGHDDALGPFTRFAVTLMGGDHTEQRYSAWMVWDRARPMVMDEVPAAPHLRIDPIPSWSVPSKAVAA